MFVSNIRRWLVVAAIGVQLPLAAAVVPSAFAQTATPAASTATPAPAASPPANVAPAATTLNGSAVGSGDIFGQLFSVFMNIFIRAAIFLGTVAFVWNGLRLQMHSFGGGPGGVAHVISLLMAGACGLVLVVLAPALINGLGHILAPFWHAGMTIPAGYCSNADISTC